MGKKKPSKNPPVLVSTVIYKIVDQYGDVITEEAAQAALARAQEHGLVHFVVPDDQLAKISYPEIEPRPAMTEDVLWWGHHLWERFKLDGDDDKAEPLQDTLLGLPIIWHDDVRWLPRLDGSIDYSDDDKPYYSPYVSNLP